MEGDLFPAGRFNYLTHLNTFPKPEQMTRINRAFSYGLIFLGRPKKDLHDLHIRQTGLPPPQFRQLLHASDDD